MIAISYRREDTAPITGRIYDRLQSIFGRDQVFLDFDSIPFGVDFRTHISESLNRCHILLVVIGPRSSGASPDGFRRIDDPTDFVGFEVAQALAQNIRVIPLLIDRTDMPSSSSLRENLKSLAFRNALRVDSGADFHHHIDRLCSSLQSTLSGSAPTVSGSPQPKMPEEAVKHQGLAGASGYDGIPSKGNLPKKRVFGWVVAIIAVVAGIFGGHSGTNAAVLITVVATITTGPTGFFVGVDLYTISGGAPFLRDSSFRFERRSSRAHRYGPLNKSPTVTDAALDRCEN